ncbi:efflux RND transporter periplasmic adaptor subunit [Microbulbifer yueqingensis]|uniref:RND family efflux transporter, MFP subunit n=1 Tax=Microbulbifer yueqingensis TaxID=658219 RepID=A0A1G8UC03_9GAMM|nr:efflux RND transporter periplasmic adaptor subunit [Microbulbifer yueqingensis]SDJ51104.1 RND family efflux transporter, MFP subunit [Microbulbifer yueqingensis]
MSTEHFARALLLAVLAVGLTACGEPAGGGHGHAHGPGGGHGDGHGGEAHGEGGHGHGDAGPALVFTDYTDTTELFVEFPPLVAGETSRFAAHVTRLADSAPLDSGRMDVILKRGERTAARFRVREPARTGIFTPGVKPREAGQFRLLVEVQDGDLQATHDLGMVTVYPSATEAEVTQPEPEGDITYLKEQQWNNPFASAEVRQRPMRPSVPAFATVEAPADAGAEIRAPSDGYFSHAGQARAGDTVEAGAVLGYLVPRLGGETDFGQLLVSLERSRSQLALAQRDVKRLTRLYEQGAVAERRLLEAREKLEVAKAEFAAAEARVEQYQRGGAEAGIALRTPVAGEVVEFNARPGAFVRAGERVFRIASRDRRWLELAVPERFAAEVPAATGAWLENAAGETVVLDEATGARVVQTSSAVDPQTRTASVTIEYPIGLGPAILGARLPAHLFTAVAEPRLAIPRSAVIDDGGRTVVYVQTGGETFARRPVELGIVDGELVEVLGGVTAGERVASRGAYFVKLAATGGEEVGHGHAH